MKKNQFLAACLFVVTSVANVSAQTPAAAPKTGKMQTNPHLKALQMAADMVQYGIAKQQPMLLVDAAHILLDHPVGNFKIDQEEQAPEPASAATPADKTTKTAQTVAFTPQALLSKAKEMAKGDATVLAAIQKVEMLQAQALEAFGGAVGGSVYTTRRINRNSRFSFTCTYVGGRYAEMYLKGDGDSDLDFYLYDSDGDLVESNTDNTDEAHFTWYPDRTMTYKVVVKNHGSVYNVLEILTN